MDREIAARWRATHLSRRSGTYCKLIGVEDGKCLVTLITGELHEIPEPAFASGMVPLDRFKGYGQKLVDEADAFEAEEALLKERRRARKTSTRKRKGNKL